ncbi:nicastrin [Hordeum vulgare subsp. vulgare]|uniref:Nicastrin n=1 Tax=Hordeum vulgare subsp. vulgare TaxID=112509 RepID=A0A8I6Y721_HORVV|nr:nicastrin [Hordeum vulgare subsp. vulgare]
MAAGSAAPLLGAVACAVLVLLAPAVSGDAATLESVPDLVKAMYVNIESFPCVRLLNLSGEIGCSNPGHGLVIAPIVRFKNSNDQLAEPSAVLLPLDQMPAFFLRVSNDPELYHKVAGVLVESNGDKLLELSPDRKFPQGDFAPYSNVSHDWNPAGSGIMWNRYDFPAFLLSEESTQTLRKIADKNEKSNNGYQANVAEFDLVMQTTKAETHGSEACLKEQSCLPLGGQSVWASLPPMSNASKEHQKPIIMVVASQDSASFFRDRSLGADSPISGLIALLTAVDALSHLHDLGKLKKQLVFAAFDGEAWGYLGSRKFLQELDEGDDSVNGINSSMIEQVLEIGSVGKGISQGDTLFYAHASRNSSISKKILDGLQSGSDSLGSDNVKVKPAASSNPGVPPSSLMSFMRKNTSTSGVVLEDFDSQFSNKFYHSHLDSPANINSSSIAAAAALVARSLYILATADMPVDLMTLNTIKVNVTLVEELIGCLLTCDPGLSCDIVKSFISPSNTCPSHYVGVFQDSPSSTQSPAYADDTSRFIWNFLADRTSTLAGNVSSCTGQCSNESEVCVGGEVEGGGRCVVSTTRYVPAYSTRLKFEDNAWHVLPANSSDPMGAADPIWTESYWNTIGLRVYAVQSTTSDRLILLAGLAVTAASYLGVVVGRGYISKMTKRD